MVCREIAIFGGISLGSTILFVYFNHTDCELMQCRTAADGWQQCLSVKTLKTFLNSLGS